ncbi:MAG: DUF692 family protein, partial [Myxococcaceae bacterium]|nr:DUF692 family protein [Myxococcaceae bacterium]
PLPYTRESLDHVVARVQQVQDALGRPLALENVSSYVEYSSSELSEWEWTTALVARSGCELVLDLNNLYVNATNHGYDAAAALARASAARIAYVHLAGHAELPGYLFDTHGGPVGDPVWALYAELVRRHGPVPTLVEWDQAVPPLARVLEEAARAADLEAAALEGVAA